MKQYKLSIINSVIAGILICAMLAACGVVEKQNPAVGTDPTEPSETISQTQPTEPETPTTETSPEVTEPTVTEPTVTEPEVTEPEVTEPQVTEPEITVTVPETTEAEQTETPVSSSSAAEAIVAAATEQLGVPYVYGGSSPEDGFDSSGFTYYCVKQAGIDFPRQLKSQLEHGEKIGYSDLAPGDVVYFSAEPDGEASFCGIYIGGGLIIYSPTPDDYVKTANITTNYWVTRFVTGIRP